MTNLKEKIVQQLDNLPNNALQQISDFIEFLTWREASNGETGDKPDGMASLRDEMLDNGWLETDLSHLGEHDAYEWQTGELEQGSAVKIDSEQGIMIAER